MKRTTKISSAVIKRLPRYRRYLYELKRKGVEKISSKEFSEIIGYTARVNPLYLNYHIKAFINLEVEPLQKPVFYPFIEKIPNVVECNCVTGDYSMLIETLFETTAQLDHFINELQQFGRTKTQIVFSTSVEQREVPVVTEEK